MEILSLQHEKQTRHHEKNDCTKAT